MTLKHGDIVTVYEDPITRQRPEGLAVLVRKNTARPCDDGLDSWDVKFIGDDYHSVCSRLIHPSDKRRR